MRKPVFFSLAILAAGVGGSRAHAQVAVGANPSIKAAQVNKADLRDIFTGASSSLAGTRILVHLFALREGGLAASFPQSFDKLSLQFHG